MATIQSFDFSEALTRMRKGKKVRRPDWPADSFIQHDPKYLWPDEEKAKKDPGKGVGSIQHVRAGESTRFSLHERDILASDWQEVA